MYELTVHDFTFRVSKAGFIWFFLPHEKGGVHVSVPACTLFVVPAVLLKTADPFYFRVVTLSCSNVKKMVQKDLRTKRIVNFTSSLCLGWSAVIDSQRFNVEVKGGSRKQTLVFAHVGMIHS